MKKYCLLIMFMLFTAGSIQAQYLVIEGIVKDEVTKEPLPYANVFFKNAGLGTITNTLGEFRILVPNEAKHDSLVVSFIGFKSKFTLIDAQYKPLTILLEEEATNLREVVITGFTAKTIVEKAIKNIPFNYRQEPFKSDGFYRVTSKKDNEYVHLSEAVFEVYQSDADHLDQQFRLEKMRAIKDENASRGIDLGLNPNGIFHFDIVHHIESFDLLNEKGIDRHIFKIDGLELVNGREAYRISFDQKNIKKSGYKGFMLIDKESLAFVYFDFGLSEIGLKYHKYGDAALRAMMRIIGIRISMNRNNYQIQYKEIDGEYFLTNVGNDASLILRSDRDHYNFKVDTRVDYLLSKFQTEGVTPFPKEETLRQNRLIEEQISSYDPDFWKDYTIVLPTEDFNEISRKLEANNQANNLKVDIENRLEKLPKDLRIRADSVISFYNQKNLFNGNVLITYQDEIILEKSYNNKITKNQKNSKFRIGSISKTFVAMLVAQLESEGLISYTDSIGAYLPNYAYPDILISQLLSHQSGIPNYLTNQSHLTNVLSNSYTTSELVKLFCSDSLDFNPGTKFEYSNSNYIILADIIETITRDDYDRVLEKRIFNPLQMKESYSGVAKDSMLLVTGYMYGKPEPFYDQENVVGAGGITSTANDLLIWSKALETDKLLPKDKINDLFEPRVSFADYDAFYGYGWLIDGYKFYVSKKHKVIYHPGTDFGFYSMFVKQPDKGITIILLNNTGEFPRFEMTELLLKQLN